MAIEDFKAKEKGLNVEVIFADHQNKPDVGSADRAQVVRLGGRGRDRRRADLRRGARDQSDHEGEGQGIPRLRRGVLGSHREGLLAQHDPLDLRHVDARQRHGKCDREDRRQVLVLPHGGLRLRPRARARHLGCRGEGRRKGRRRGAPSLPDVGLLVLPAPGAGLEGARSSGWPTRAPTRRTRSSRRPSSES